MNVPENLLYTSDHEWIRLEGDEVVVGVTEFAQSELGELVFVDLPAIGKIVTKAATFCVVESTKAASDVYAPVSGAVVGKNDTLTTDPTLVNSDPYGQGWLVRMGSLNKEEIASLLSAAQYSELLRGKGA